MATPRTNASAAASNDRVKTLNRLVRSDKLTDVTIVTTSPDSGTVTFRAHKCVLAAVSPMFRTMFTSQLSCDTDEVNVTDIEPTVMRLLLKHFYGEKLIVTDPSVICHLLYAARKYVLEDLQKRLTNAIIDQIPADFNLALIVLDWDQFIGDDRLLSDAAAQLELHSVENIDTLLCSVSRKTFLRVLRLENANCLLPAEINFMEFVVQWACVEFDRLGISPEDKAAQKNRDVQDAIKLIKVGELKPLSLECNQTVEEIIDTVPITKLTLLITSRDDLNFSRNEPLTYVEFPSAIKSTLPNSSNCASWTLSLQWSHTIRFLHLRMPFTEAILSFVLRSNSKESDCQIRGKVRKSADTHGNCWQEIVFPGPLDPDTEHELKLSFSTSSRKPHELELPLFRIPKIKYIRLQHNLDIKVDTQSADTPIHFMSFGCTKDRKSWTRSMLSPAAIDPVHLFRRLSISAMPDIPSDSSPVESQEL